MIVEESARLSCPTATNMPDAALMTLIRAMVATDRAVALSLLEANPALARAHFELGATRRTAKTYHMYEIGHYIYAGDTALHVAAAAHQQEIVQKLIAAGANVRARNRRGAEPLHYAVDGSATVARLIAVGADPNATDKSGVTPLHRAVRTRCAAAVKALLEAGADPRRKNNSGSTPMLLATQNTGRGGSGSRGAKAQQELIVQLLREHLNRQI